MEDPFPTCIILAFWMYFVLIFGPTWMKDKQPFNLRTILIIYNFLQIIASVYVFVRVSILLSLYYQNILLYFGVQTHIIIEL